MSGTLGHLRSMKRRQALNSNVINTMSPEEKIEMLEKGLSSLRKEMNTKMKIILEILTVRNEQVSAHKKLMDREQKLCTTLMLHVYEYDSDDQHSQDDYDPASAKAKRQTVKASKKETRKRRKMTQPKLSSETDDAAGEKKSFVEVDPLDVLVMGNSSDDDDGDESREDSFVRSMGRGEGDKVQIKAELDGEEGVNVLEVNEEELARTHPYACGICKKRYRARTSLWRHTRFECTTVSPNYYCSLCPASTKRRDNFLKHLKKKHMILADKNSCLNYVRQTLGDGEDEARTSLQGIFEESNNSVGMEISSQPTQVITSDEEEDVQT